MVEEMQVLWACFDAPAPVWPDAEIRRWPADVLERLVQQGLVVEAGQLDRVACPDCPDGHVEEIIERRGADSRLRCYIPCPQSLRVEISPAALRRWTLDVEKVVAAVASAMSMQARPSAIIPGRLWRLGKTRWQGVSREVLLARGLAWADGQTIPRHVGTGGRPIVLVADQAPLAELWPGRLPAVIVLSRVASLGATGIDVDVTHMMMLVKDADAAAERASLLPIAPKDRTKVINQHVRAAMKKHLDQEAYAAAYRLHGTARKAAAALEKEGIKVHFSTIARAAERVKKTEEIARTTDSQSVRRTVASHRRDNGKKTLQRSQHTDYE